MRYLLVFLYSLGSLVLSAQARLVFNNDAFLVIDNSAFVVLENPAANAITETGTGGRIVSEGENNRLRWMVGTTTGTYTVPFSTNAGVEFPLSIDITSAGAGAGNLTFSTYNGASWDNNTYRPSDVTHMFDFLTGSVNNSDHVIDRFWIVDPVSYTTKPGATLSITYIDAEHTPAGNTIVESDLGAQRFNTSSGIWGDYLPQGTVNTATNTVSAIPVTSANFFRSWTLSELSTPLPITLLNFAAGCYNDKVRVQFTTASESDVMQFNIMGSYDGLDFVELETVMPTGSAGINAYTVEVSSQYKYYALETREMNGQTKTEAVQYQDCGATNEAGAYVANGSIVTDLNLNSADQVNFTLFEASGKLVANTLVNVPEGKTRLQLNDINLSRGIYFLRITSAANNLNRSIKIFK